MVVVVVVMRYHNTRQHVLARVQLHVGIAWEHLLLAAKSCLMHPLQSIKTCHLIAVFRRCCCRSFSHVLGIDGDAMHILAAKELKEQGHLEYQNASADDKQVHTTNIP